MPDYLSCGSCPVDFELADIVSFMEHKRQSCIDGNSDSEPLECIKCCKRFHTPWPLLMHIQMDHEILIVRNLNQLSLPLSFKTTVTPLVQHDKNISMETNNLENSVETQKNKDAFTQTQNSKKSPSCCQPRILPSCCQKIEPQCYDEPCVCPAVSEIICTSETCYINQDPQNLDSDIGSCCACPQGLLKKESREVQTDIEYNDDVDINFLLSNQSDSSREFSRISQQSIPFTSQQYNADFAMTMDKPWGYYTQAGSNNINHTSNYMDTFDNNNYEMLMPNIQHSNNNQNYMPPNNNLRIANSRNLTPSPNHLNTDNPLYTSLTTDNNVTTLFQESHNSFQYCGLNPQDNPNNKNSLIIPYMSPSLKESNPLFPRNENCSTNFIPSESDISADFNTENYNEKIENERKEFRFLCSNCGKRFRQKVHLRKHVMSQHARQKPHKCSQCGYTTVEKSHLTVHIRTHTGERPYTCRRCSYSSAQNCTLKSHYLRRHPGDQIECTLCGSYFITEQERNNHQRSCRIVNGVSNNGSVVTNNQSNCANFTDSSKTA